MEENQPVFELQIDQSASRSLIDAARWARFIAIFCFAAMGVFILLMIGFQAKMTYTVSNYIPGMTSSEGFGLLIGVILIIFLIVTVILVFLIRGATMIKRGVETKNQQDLIDGLRALKTYFSIYGVLAIIGLFFNLLALLK